MANRNPQPLTTLPLAPLAYDVQYQNNLVRLLNNNFNSIKNPGNSQSHSIAITSAPTSPVDPNTGQTLADGTVWNDEGFLKILPTGNPGNINADKVNCNTLNAAVSVTTPDVEATTVNTTTVNATTVNTTDVNASGTVSANIVSATTEVDTATVNTTYVDTTYVNTTYVNTTYVDAASVDVSGAYYVDSTQVVTNQQPAIPDATNINNITGLANLSTGYVLASTSSNIVSVVNQILTVLRTHGLIAP